MKYLLIAITLLFSACSIKNYEHTASKLIVIKTPNLKYSDLGYIRNSDKAVQVEIFSAGMSVEKISVNTLICTLENCMSKSGFNEYYLHASYPDDTLQNILLGSEVFAGQNRVKTADGFEQKIENSDVSISYKVTSSSISFKDTKNNILFKIKDTK